MVETKLWRNPQAVREVLAQILDYASRLASLSVEELEAACQNAKQGTLSKGESLFSYLLKQCPEEVLDEADFHDRLQHHLRSGRFLLLIVGDGIREDLERILGQLHRNAQWHFSFGLVELEIYKGPENEDYLIVPYRLAHSTEIVRSVVKVEGDLPAHIRVTPTESLPGKERYLDEQDFLDKVEPPLLRELYVRILDWAKGKLEPRVRQKSIGFWLRHPGASKDLIIVRIYEDGTILLAPPRLPPQIEKMGVSPEILESSYLEMQTLLGVTGPVVEKNVPLNTLSWGAIEGKLEALLDILDRLIEDLRSAEPTESQQIPERGED